MHVWFIEWERMRNIVAFSSSWQYRFYHLSLNHYGERCSDVRWNYGWARAFEMRDRAWKFVCALFANGKYWKMLIVWKSILLAYLRVYAGFLRWLYGYVGDIRLFFMWSDEMISIVHKWKLGKQQIRCLRLCEW